MDKTIHEKQHNMLMDLLIDAYKTWDERSRHFLLSDYVVDFLLAHNVFVLPAPLGFPYYRLVGKPYKFGVGYFTSIRSGKVTLYNAECIIKDLGDTVFFTKEEAIQRAESIEWIRSEGGELVATNVD